MKTRLKHSLLIWGISMAGIAFAQDPFTGALKMGFTDVAATKQRAEAGDALAQLSLGDTYLTNLKPSEALSWYRKASEQGLVEAKSRLGEILLFGGFGIPSTANVKPNPAEGIRWTFDAATNRNTKAYLNMSKAFQNGIGVSTNLIQAYAWLQLYAESGNILGQTWLNQLALKMDTKSIQEARAMTAQFKSGHWPVLLVRKLPEGDSRLKLGGIMVGGKTPLAIINGKTLTEGETTIISLKEGSLTIKCVQIKQDAVLVAIEGENEPRWLHLK